MDDDKFRLEALRLVRKNIPDRSERMGAVDALIDMYVDDNGVAPDGDVTEKLTDYILREELTDTPCNKTSTVSYPFLSDSQRKYRIKREKPLDFAESVSSSSVDINYYDSDEDRLSYEIKRETEKYREVNREQPITTYNLREIMGNEAFDAAYPFKLCPYTAFRGETHVEWSLDVRRRDGFTCQKCGKSGYNGMHAHHIEAYNVAIDLRNDVSNGITLCKKCHRDFHRTYGYGHNTRYQIDEWMGDSYYEL